MDDRTKLFPLAATLAVCSAAVLYWTRSRGNAGPSPLHQRTVDLLPVEKTLAGGGGGDNAMSTLTWFRGDVDDATGTLRARAAAVLAANPWLAGRVGRRGGEWALTYSRDATADEMLEGCFRIRRDAISRDVPLSEMGSRLAGMLPKTGPDEPLFLISILPCSHDESRHFAVVVSLSHVIGDGATFYAVQNMLLRESEPVRSLIVERIRSTEEQQIDAMGGRREYGVLSSAGFVANCIGGALVSAVYKRKYAATSRLYLVDEEGMEAAKREAVANDNDTEFVSSNDVLTSWFFQSCGCCHGMMALNFRGRLEGHDERHAGNYENVVFYRKEDSAGPALIRKSLAGRPFRRRVTAQTPMPGFFAMATSSNAICSNWSSFAAPCDLLCDRGGCEEEVQIPLYNVAALLPSTLAICLVFRAGPRGLAVLVAGAPDKLAGLEKEVPFLNGKETLK